MILFPSSSERNLAHLPRCKPDMLQHHQLDCQHHFYIEKLGIQTALANGGSILEFASGAVVDFHQRHNCFVPKFFEEFLKGRCLGCTSSDNPLKQKHRSV